MRRQYRPEISRDCSTFYAAKSEQPSRAVIDKAGMAQAPNPKGSPKMFNSISVAALLDSNRELSLDDLDLVLGGNNATSATGSGDDDPRPQPMAGLTTIPTLTTVTPVNVNVDVRSTETHTGGEGPIDRLAQTAYEIGHEVVDLAHKAGDIVYDTIHPIGQALGQLGHDVIMSIDQHVTGTSPSSGTGH
jgi:hypothetical protein